MGLEGSGSTRLLVSASMSVRHVTCGVGRERIDPSPGFDEYECKARYGSCGNQSAVKTERLDRSPRFLVRHRLRLESPRSVLNSGLS